VIGHIKVLLAISVVFDVHMFKSTTDVISYTLQMVCSEPEKSHELTGPSLRAEVNNNAVVVTFHPFRESYKLLTYIMGYDHVDLYEMYLLSSLMLSKHLKIPELQ
jgi:hypothetical protein